MTEQYDVFISYAHADDEIPIGTSAEMGWIGTLAANLNIGPNVLRKEIFIDYQLKPGDEFNEELIVKVKNSKLLVIFLSKNYIKSDWCGKELEHFIQSHSDNPEKPKNVFVVELFPYNRLKKLPDNIRNIRKNLISEQFWHIPPNTDTPLLSGYPVPKDHDTNYWNSLNSLQLSIDEKLENYLESTNNKKNSSGLEQKNPSFISSKNSTDKPFATVLLANVTDDLVDKRNEVKLALRSENILVLPEQSDYVGLNSKEFDKNFAEDLKKSELFIQLLSPFAGQKGNGFTAPLPRLQFQIALKENCPIIQWCEKSLDPEIISDSSHKQLFKTEFIRATNLTDFKSEIIEWFRAKKTESENAIKVAESLPQLHVGQKYIFVDDLASTEEIREKIRTTIRKQNFEIRSIPAGLPLEVAKESLRPCLAGITIFTDHTKKETIYYRLLFFLNQIAAAKLPMLRWGVYLQEGDVASIFGVDSAHVVAIRENDLAPFLQELTP